jgi:hypothetical protein
MIVDNLFRGFQKSGTKSRGVFYFLYLCGDFVYFFGGLECVGHSFAYVAHLLFLRDVWIRTQSTAVASWRATDLATHPSA